MQTIYESRGVAVTKITWERLWLEGNFGGFCTAPRLLKQEKLAIPINILPILANSLKEAIKVAQVESSSSILFWKHDFNEKGTLI